MRELNSLLVFSKIFPGGSEALWGREAGGADILVQAMDVVMAVWTYEKRSAVRSPTQHAAMTYAARCDDVCSTLRWLMQCTASIHMKYCCEVRNTEKRLSHLSSGWQEPPFICLPDVVGISVLISAGYLSGCFSAQPKVFPSIACTPSGLPPDRFLVLSKRRNVLA